MDDFFLDRVIGDFILLLLISGDVNGDFNPSKIGPRSKKLSQNNCSASSLVTNPAFKYKTPPAF